MMLLAFGATANAAPVSKCNAAKKKCIGKYIAAVMGCHAKAESKSLAVDSGCLSKAAAKITGGGKGCFDKADAKNDGCSITGDASSQLADADAFILDVVDDIDPGYPTPHTNKCDAGEKKCVGKKAAGLMGCKAKENKDGVGDVNCEPKIQGKFTNGSGKGCMDKLIAKNAGPCDGATAAGLEVKIDAWANAAADEADGMGGGGATPTPMPTSTPGVTCGNGVNDPGEPCDESASSAGWAQCGPSFTCTGCNCACPSTVTFTGDPTSAFSILDTGWTGISHRAPIISNGQTTVTLSGCTGSTRPCGVCNVSGPVENPQANTGQLATRRCLSDSSTRCTSDGDCTGGVGDCQYFFGAPLPLAAGGVSTCVVNQFNGSVSGTANVETGYAVTSAHLTSRVYNGLAIDNPCPRCSDAGGFNDGIAGGTCDGGPRAGLGCDANGDVPSRPDFGRTSLDCPPASGAQIATLPIDLSNKTDVVTRTLSTANSNCTGSPGDKCLCSTCDNINADPCFTDLDCPPGGICGGKRCLSGTNNGAACSVAGDCPGGACARPGEPTKPSGCVDDTTVADRVMECLDGGDGEGACTIGPTDQNCTVASGHGQRGCTSDVDCGGGVGSCESIPRRCFLTGGGTFQPSGQNDGTDTLVAVGMADTPVQDVSNPTLAAVFCVGPTSAPAVNNVAGLPGPSRITLQGQAVGQP